MELNRHAGVDEYNDHYGKSAAGSFHCRLDQADGSPCEFKDKAFEIIPSEEKKQKENAKSEKRFIGCLQRNKICM